MNKIFLCWAVLGLLVAGLSGCDVGYANDVTKVQEESRINRGIPSATELPPGIGEDLPIQTTESTPAPETQPAQPITQNQ